MNDNHILVDENNYRICKYCNTILCFEEPHKQKGHLIQCMRCQTPFCQACFVDAHGEANFQEMFDDGDVDLLCPHCF